MLLCSDVSGAVCAVVLRRFVEYVILCTYVSETICAVSMLRHFGDCMYCYASTFRTLYVLCSDVSEAIGALMSDVSETAVTSRRFGVISCYAPTFRKLCAYMLRHFGDYVLLLSGVLRYFCVLR